MTDNANALIKALRQNSISRAAIDAAWPSWWTEAADNSPSGRAELRFELARSLGLEAKSLLGERVEFVWNDEARFKHLSTENRTEQAALASFGIAIGRILLRATQAREGLQAVQALELRSAILSQFEYVDLHSLITTCWALGIPVIHLRVFPLETKSMHAMVVAEAGRFAILLGRDASFPAPVAFTLAHELGHICLQHVQSKSALVDLEDPAAARDGDVEEREADDFALTILTGTPRPNIQTNVISFNARSLARAVLEAGPRYRIEPGTLALCLAHQNEVWPAANAALKHIYSEVKPVCREVNNIALSEIQWDSLEPEACNYLKNIMEVR